MRENPRATFGTRSSASTDFGQSNLQCFPGLLRLLRWGGSEPTSTVARQQPDTLARLKIIPVGMPPSLRAKAKRKKKPRRANR